VRRGDDPGRERVRWERWGREERRRRESSLEGREREREKYMYYTPILSHK
jgi:hypothetical protein